MRRPRFCAVAAVPAVSPVAGPGRVQVPATPPFPSRPVCPSPTPAAAPAPRATGACVLAARLSRHPLRRRWVHHPVTCAAWARASALQPWTLGSRRVTRARRPGTCTRAASPSSGRGLWAECGAGEGRENHPALRRLRPRTLSGRRGGRGGRTGKNQEASCSPPLPGRGGTAEL